MKEGSEEKLFGGLMGDDVGVGSKCARSVVTNDGKRIVLVC